MTSVYFCKSRASIKDVCQSHADVELGHGKVFFEDLINNSCHTLLSGFLHNASKRMLTLIDVNGQARQIYTTLV